MQNNILLLCPHIILYYVMNNDLFQTLYNKNLAHVFSRNVMYWAELFMYFIHVFMYLCQGSSLCNLIKLFCYRVELKSNANAVLKISFKKLEFSSVQHWTLLGVQALPSKSCCYSQQTDVCVRGLVNVFKFGVWAK